MHRCLKIRIFSLLLCLTGPCVAFGQDSRSVRLVEITSRRSVISTTSRRFKNSNTSPDATENSTDLAISKEGDGYKLNGQTIDPHLIAALVSALTAPPNAAPNLDDLGVTPAWLKEHAGSVAQSVSESMSVGGKHVPQAALETIFADPAIMNAIVPKLFDPRGHLCADCTHYHLMVTVAITFDDGTKLAAGTSSQTPFMLPWRFTSATAYNAEISRAVAALMPENSANRALLLPEHFDRQLAAAAVPQAMELDVERRAGSAIDALRGKYIVERASIGEFSDLALRGPLQPMPADSTIFFELRRSDAPDIFFGEELILPFADGNVVGTAAFLQRAPQYEQLVLSIPWLNQFAQQNKGIVRFNLALFHDVSLSDQTAQLFAQDMQALGRDEWAAKTEAAKGQIAVLMVGLGGSQSEWLVFPDRHMVLWRYFPTAVYQPNQRNWKPVSFIGKPCSSKTAGGFMGCLGEEISPDGAVITPQ